MPPPLISISSFPVFISLLSFLSSTHANATTHATHARSRTGADFEKEDAVELPARACVHAIFSAKKRFFDDVGDAKGSAAFAATVAPLVEVARQHRNGRLGHSFHVLSGLGELVVRR